MSWDPSVYTGFSAQRLRPGIDLLGRVPDHRPLRIVDLGCGTGNLTQLLEHRWPDAAITGVDLSSEMLAEARRLETGIEWVRAGIETWEPPKPLDVVFSNAALHWLDRHETLFPRIAEWLAPGGTLAVQMPDNWRMPTHRIPAAILDESGWPIQARRALMRDRVAEPGAYRSWLADGFGDVDIWTTTYHHVLTGPDPVLTWVEGSVLRPVLAALSESRAAEFRQRCRVAYGEAYPPRADGTTILPFTRFFLVATGRVPAAGG